MCLQYNMNLACVRIWILQESLCKSNRMLQKNSSTPVIPHSLIPAKHNPHHHHQHQHLSTFGHFGEGFNHFFLLARKQTPKSVSVYKFGLKKGSQPNVIPLYPTGEAKHTKPPLALLSQRPNLSIVQQYTCNGHVQLTGRVKKDMT